MRYAYEINAQRIIELVKSRDGIETKQIRDILDLSVNQFVCAQPLITKDCYRIKKQWKVKVVEEVPPRIRKNSLATIIYRMMPVGQLGLKESLGMPKDPIWRALRLLRTHKLIHITGYESSPTGLLPMYGKGFGEDAPRPDSKLLRSERAKRYRANSKEKAIFHDKSYKEKNRALLNEKQKARYHARKDEINAKARERARLMREAMSKSVVMTSWSGGNPFASLMQ